MAVKTGEWLFEIQVSTCQITNTARISKVRLEKLGQFPTALMNLLIEDLFLQGKDSFDMESSLLSNRAIPCPDT